MMSWGAYVSLADLLAGTSAPPDKDRAEMVSPMHDAFVVRLSREGARETARLRWGLVPWWAKDYGIGTQFIHARAETIETTKAYCEAFRYRRGLIIVSEFLNRGMSRQRNASPTASGRTTASPSRSPASGNAGSNRTMRRSKPSRLSHCRRMR